MEKLLGQLLKEVREAGGTTAQLLDQISFEEDPVAHHIINEIDSQLSIWEDEITDLINRYS